MKGNLAPEGAIVKVAGLKKLQFTEEQDVLIQKRQLIKLLKIENIKTVILLL